MNEKLIKMAAELAAGKRILQAWATCLAKLAEVNLYEDAKLELLEFFIFVRTPEPVDYSKWESPAQVAANIEARAEFAHAYQECLTILMAAKFNKYGASQFLERFVYD